MKAAVDEGRAVIACAYPGHVPAQLQGQLPARGTPFVARIVDGKVAQVVTGTPESAVSVMLRGLAAAR